MIQITVHGELLFRLDQIPKKLRSALSSKFRALLEEVFIKAAAQFSDSMKDEISRGVEEQGSLLIGYVEPTSAKAGAVESGGKGYYEIFPVKARLLRFMGREGKLVFTPRVFHPPMRGKHYIRDTILANRARIESELADELNSLRL